MRFFLILSLSLLIFPLDVLAQEEAAQGASAPGAFPKFVIETVWFILMAIFVFYMMVVRPKDQRDRDMQEYLKTAKKGDAVLVNSSIFGKFQSASGDRITVELAPNMKVDVRADAVKPLTEDVATQAKVENIQSKNRKRQK